MTESYGINIEMVAIVFIIAILIGLLFDDEFEIKTCQFNVDGF